MTLENAIQVLSSIGAVITSLVTLLKGFQVSKQVQEVHLSVNSRIDEMLSLAKIAAHAEGMKEGVLTGAVLATNPSAITLQDIKPAVTPMPPSDSRGKVG
jgi:5-enolpyruvylshikimate-3-phosphate synthase